jgi:CspA family cold shock protein
MKSAAAKGTVKTYSEQKGLGFIEPDDGGQIVFYRSSIQGDGYKNLNPGDRVQFEVEKSVRSLEAKNVERL